MDDLNDLHQTFKKIIIYIAVLFFIFLIFGYFIRNLYIFSSVMNKTTFLIYGSGLLLGTCLSVLRLYMLKRSLIKISIFTEGKAKLYGMGQFYLRLLLSFIVLLIAVKSPYIDFFGAVLGVIISQLSPYIVGLTLKDKKTFDIKNDNDFEDNNNSNEFINNLDKEDL